MLGGVAVKIFMITTSQSVSVHCLRSDFLLISFNLLSKICMAAFSFSCLFRLINLILGHYDAFILLYFCNFQNNMYSIKVAGGHLHPLTFQIISEGYRRYLALCLTSSVSQSVSAFLFFKTHIRVLLDHVGS